MIFPLRIRRTRLPGSRGRLPSRIRKALNETHTELQNFTQSFINDILQHARAQPRD